MKRTEDGRRQKKVFRGNSRYLLFALLKKPTDTYTAHNTSFITNILSDLIFSLPIY